MTGTPYPDTHDRLPLMTVVRTSHVDHQSWVRCDEQLVREAARLHGAVHTALDAGAGCGRLTAALASVAEDIISLEPDASRAAAARGEAGIHATTIGTVCSEIGDYRPAAPFDLVVCSHVLQHLTYDDQEHALSALRQFTDDDGILLLMAVTTDTPVGALYETTFTVAGSARTCLRRTGDRAECLRVTPASSSAEDPVQPVLSTWHAGIGEIAALVSRCGFVVHDARAYRRFFHRVVGLDGIVREVHAADCYLLGRVA